MSKSKIENRLPDMQPNSDQKAELLPSAQLLPNPLLPAVPLPFTFDWWLGCAIKAKWKAENLAFRSYYWDVAYYCHIRKNKCLVRHSR